MKTILFALAAATCLPTFAATVGHTFTGVTSSNVVDPGDFTTEFPVGTKWTVLVEWDSAATGEVFSDSQAKYPLTKFTLSLQGKTGTWTTSSLAEKASFSLNKFGSHEIQFTSGGDPSHHTNQNIEGLQPFSINVTLKDPTGKAIGAFTPAPSGIDLSKWDIAASEFKMYMSNMGTPVIYGKLQAPATGAEISIQQPVGSELKDGAAKKSFGTVKLGKKSAAKTFTIKNAGGKTLKNLAVAVTGKHNKDFTITAPSKKSLAPGASTTFKVTFKPMAKGTRKAALEIKSNDKDESPFDIKVTGLGSK
ncbi:MAG: choice-of-anchor D domain-containing protein [Verrucomicrobiaceae bacterium]|nr:MAG: choice-of-anchor D domain-containing protein [Verrucomicrobiaceae bacterium]